MIHIPHIETDVTLACQLSCVACNHHVPLWRVRPSGPPMANPRQVAQDLGALSRVLHADAWGALGGEPTLHPELVRILGIVRVSGIADTVEVWSNGISLKKMPPKFWESFDRLVLSRYDGKIDDEHMAWVESRCRDRGVELRVMDERRAPNFKTLLEPAPTNAEETRTKFAGCFFRHFSRVANEGFFYTCCCAPHMPVLIQGRPHGSDGIAIDGITEQSLRAYLERTEPLGACAICAGRDTAVSIQWSEEKRPLEWIRKSGHVVQETEMR
jgi:GTP 3',8-cyclase